MIWRSAHPSEGARWFSQLSVPWWVAGGWALDLFAGNQSRPHGDLDIGVLRRDVAEVLAMLSSWEIVEAKGGVLSPLRAGATPRLDVNSLWCRTKGMARWMLELMLDESADDCWVFRRHPDIRRELSRAVQRSSEGLPYLAPEIQLLYKAKAIRGCDRADFDYVAPLLDQSARNWLRNALIKSEPGHEWIARLA